MQALCANQWRGNVRELGHAIESAVLMTENDRIGLDDLPFGGEDADPEALGEPLQATLPSGALELVEGGATDAAKSWPYSLDAVIREASKLALIRALQATEGNCHRAAELLGVSRYTVYRMLNRFGLAEGRTYRTFRKPTVRRAEKSGGVAPVDAGVEEVPAPRGATRATLPSRRGLQGGLRRSAFRRRRRFDSRCRREPAPARSASRAS
jgi:hypothetical protein